MGMPNSGMPCPCCSIDRLRLVALRSSKEQRQDAVAALRFDAVGVDLDRHGQRPVEGTRRALATMKAHRVRILDRRLARAAYRVSPDQHLLTCPARLWRNRAVRQRRSAIGWAV